MTALAANMNKRHLMSQMAGRSSGSLHTNIFFKSRAVVETGLVLKLRANGAVILVPRFALEKLVLLGRDAAGAPRALVYDEANQTLEAPGAGAGGAPLRLRVFDEVRVLVLVEERGLDRKELVVKIVSPAFAESAVPAGVVVEDRTAAPAAAAPAAAPPAAAGGKRAADDAGDAARATKRK